MVLGDADKPALTAERLTARLRFFPLLIGRVEIADVSLERPTHRRRARSRTATPTGRRCIGGAGAQPEAGRAAAVPPSPKCASTGGTVVLRDARAQASARRSTTSNCRSAWPSISKSFGATGRFIWHGEPVDASLTLADFPAALAGDRTGSSFGSPARRSRSPSKARSALSPTLKIEGTLAADSAIAARGAALGRAEAAAGRRLRPLRAQGADQCDRAAPSRSPASISSLTAIPPKACSPSPPTAARPCRARSPPTRSISRPTFRPSACSPPTGTNGTRGRSRSTACRHAISTCGCRRRKIAVADAKIGRTAIGANLRGGHLVVTIGEAQAYGGVIKGSLTLANVDGRRGREIAAAVHRGRSRKLRLASCSGCTASRAKAPSPSPSKAPATACWR